MNKQAFIAETDEHGAIACVWVADSLARGPRIFDTRLHSPKLEAAECFGAPRHQIAAWLTSQYNAAEIKYD